MDRVQVIRRFWFSAGHRYWVEAWPPEKNEAVFGPLTRFHGHNYLLEVAVEGPVDPVTGMVLNVTELKGIVEEVLEAYDHRNLNEDHPYFRERQPSTENLARALFQEIAPRLPEGIVLNWVRVWEGDDVGSEYRGGGRVQVVRRYAFSAAHRLYVKGWSEEENRRTFGKCTWPHGHGHDYRLEVAVEGEPDPVTGWAVDLRELDAGVEEVLAPLRYRLLDELPPFQNRTSTGENLLLYLWEVLEARWGRRLRRLRLWETEKNVFQIER